MSYPVRPNSFAFTSAHSSYWLLRQYALHHEHLYRVKVRRESEFRKLLAHYQHLPEIVLMGNFIVERASILSLCREWGVNTVHNEDGFFPHYKTAHADPLGFCWESSLSRMVFRECMPLQQQSAEQARQEWLNFQPAVLPDSVKRPFVFTPLQLIKDKVNYWDLKLKDWTGLLRELRVSLPGEIQLVIKEHPRSRSRDVAGVYELVRDLPNTVLVPPRMHLKSLLKECSAVAGANSSVLYEARLMFHKPTYAFARSWFTGHNELFMPLRIGYPRPVPRLDWVEDNSRMRTERLDAYTDWFLAQLLARQIDHGTAEREPKFFKEFVHRLSYHSYIKYGEEIFTDSLATRPQGTRRPDEPVH